MTDSPTEAVSRDTSAAEDRRREVMRLAHDALLRRTLAYVGGSLAAFLPLLEFVLLSREKGDLLLPSPLADFFVTVGTILAVGLSVATLVSFREVVYIERVGRFNPEDIVRSQSPRSIIIRAWTGRFGNDPDSLWLDVGVATAIVLVAALIVWLDASVLSLPQP